MQRLRYPTRHLYRPWLRPLNPLQQIFESQHIFKNKDEIFNKELDAAVEKLINLYDNHRIEKVFKNQHILYAYVPMNFLWNRKEYTIKLFLGANSRLRDTGMDLVNISSNNILDFQPKDVMPAYRILYEESDRWNIISIVIQVSPKFIQNYPDNKELLIGNIKHELIHFVH